MQVWFWYRSAWGSKARYARYDSVWYFGEFVF